MEEHKSELLSSQRHEMVNNSGEDIEDDLRAVTAVKSPARVEDGLKSESGQMLTMMNTLTQFSDISALLLTGDYVSLLQPNADSIILYNNNNAGDSSTSSNVVCISGSAGRSIDSISRNSVCDILRDCSSINTCNSGATSYAGNCLDSVYSIDVCNSGATSEDSMNDISGIKGNSILNTNSISKSVRTSSVSNNIKGARDNYETNNMNYSSSDAIRNRYIDNSDTEYSSAVYSDSDTIENASTLYSASNCENKDNILSNSPSSNAPSVTLSSQGGGKMRGNRLKSVGGGKEVRYCEVCGDRALGCNFDAVSCESCKAFFRRNALKEQQMHCLFTGSCQIDVNTRRFCPYCRLKKCVAVGMKKDLILDEEERKQRMAKVLKNRVRRQTRHLNDADLNSSSDANIASPLSVASPENIHFIEDAKTSISATATVVAASFETSSTLQDATTLRPENTNLLTLSGLIGDSLWSGSRAGAVPTAVLDSLILRRLTADETHLVHELNQVYDLSFTVDLEPLIHIKQLDPSLNQLVNQSSITVLRLIKFAKRLQEFVRLSQECQISILKGCWIHMLLLRSVSLYDCERDVWVTPRGDIPTEILKNATGYVQLHDDHITYCKSMKSVIGNDLTIVVILLVLVLFSPDGTHVISRELVSNIQDRYLILLKHYLEAKYTYEKAAEMYPRLLSKVRELESLAESHCRILLDVDPQEIEPIMLEILDLKHSIGR